MAHTGFVTNRQVIILLIKEHEPKKGKRRGTSYCMRFFFVWYIFSKIFKS